MEHDGDTGSEQVSAELYDAAPMGDDAAVVLLAKLSGKTDRAEDGRFKPREIPSDEKVVGLDGKPVEAKAEEVKPEAPAEDEDDDPELEMPGEEGQEPRRLKLSEVWQGYEEGQKLKAEVETMREAVRQVPQQWTEALTQTVKTREVLVRDLERLAQIMSPTPPNEQLITPTSHLYDPEAYHAQLQKYREDVQIHQQLRQRTEKEQKRLADEARAIRDAQAMRSMQELARSWPEIKDAKVQQEVAGFMKEAGFADSEIAEITDHRAYLIIRDAMAYRASQNKGKEVAKVVSQKPKIVKGSARTGSPKAAQRSDAMARLRATGGTDAAVAALRALR